MPRRSIWSARQRAALFDLPTDEAAPLRHYTMSDDDIEQIRLPRSLACARIAIQTLRFGRRHGENTWWKSGASMATGASRGDAPGT